MLKIRHLVLAATAMGVGACTEQEDQTLPFDPATTTTSSGTVATTGGRVTLASGAELTVPAGALTGTSNITLTRVPNPTLPAGIGAALGTQSVQVGAGGSVGFAANGSAQMEIIVPGLAGNADAWLADFALTNASGTEIASDVGVDISNGRVIGNFSDFGTLTPVIPPASERVTVGSGIPVTSVVGDGVSAELFTGPVRTISQNCRMRAGGTTTVPQCAGFQAFGSAQVLNQFGAAALQRVRISGSITLTGDPRLAGGAAATGSISVAGVIRVRQSGTTANGVAPRFPVRVSLVAGANARVSQAAQTNILTLSGFSVNLAQPAFGQAQLPSSFTIVPTSATAGQFVYNGSVNIGNNVAGSIQARFPFTIGY
jgi:hypothetical protein